MQTIRWKRLEELLKNAHVFRYLDELFGPSGDVKSFCRDIYEALVNEEVIEDSVSIEFDEKDLWMDYIIYEVGI